MRRRRGDEEAGLIRLARLLGHCRSCSCTIGARDGAQSGKKVQGALREEWRKETSNARKKKKGEGRSMPFSSLHHVGELARTATADVFDRIQLHQDL